MKIVLSKDGTKQRTAELIVLNRVLHLIEDTKHDLILPTNSYQENHVNLTLGIFKDFIEKPINNSISNNLGREKIKNEYEMDFEDEFVKRLLQSGNPESSRL